MGAAEALVLAAVVAVLFWLAGPLRRRLERWLARRLGHGRVVGRVVVLGRRRDGTFSREDRHDH
ncbi:MAG: hypothetical protein E6J55_07910 [Deltaproteobacteria bacterium]|nr:MAG: hypothetical protein E6J55_07910 [Deltaproteobacteria bacterium]